MPKLHIEICGQGMMLVVLLVRGLNYGQSGLWKHKEKYLEAEKKFRRALYQARCNAKKEKISKGYLEELSKL